MTKTTAMAMGKPLRVMKFGGTSVGDASCIARVVEIIGKASKEALVAVVVSAMSGVTNRLIEAANQAAAGNEGAVAEVFGELRQRHEEADMALIGSVLRRERVESRLHDILAEGERLCRGVALLRELTPRTLDAIAGLGERICAPLVAAALEENGVASEALDATELLVTDTYHGGAEPCVERTRARCQSRLLPLLEKTIVPVITGFIGATEAGVLTTLGRGGSDYSATILGAALDASAVVIWSDVPGLLTADPKLVSDAATIAEISHREAAELAYFGAKVLHPKTLRPVMQRGIPVWIKNTFTPDDPGTKITPAGVANASGVKALATVREASQITVAGHGTERVPEVLARTVAAAARVRVDVLLISQSSSHNDICLVIPSTLAQPMVDALRGEFFGSVIKEQTEPRVAAAEVSVVTLVGQHMQMGSAAMARAFARLERANVWIIATAQGSSDCSMSFVVARQDMEAVLAVFHRELELGLAGKRPVMAESPSSVWKYQPEQATAD